MTVELNWLEICDTGFVKLRDSVRKEAIMPSVSLSVPVRLRYFVYFMVFKPKSCGKRSAARRRFVQRYPVNAGSSGTVYSRFL